MAVGSDGGSGSRAPLLLVAALVVLAALTVVRVLDRVGPDVEFVILSALVIAVPVLGVLIYVGLWYRALPEPADDAPEAAGHANRVAVRGNGSDATPVPPQTRAGANGDTRPCPHCDRMIHRDTQMCPYCMTVASIPTGREG